MLVMKRIEIERNRGSKKLTVHTDFNITRHRDIKDVVESISGVEEVDLNFYKKYSFTVNVGKLFNTEKVMENIQSAVLTYLEEHEQDEAGN